MKRQAIAGLMGILVLGGCCACTSALADDEGTVEVSPTASAVANAAAPSSTPAQTQQPLFKELDKAERIAALSKVVRLVWDPQVVVTDKIYYMTAGQKWAGMGGGLIGEAIVGTSIEPRYEALQRTMLANGIDPGKILLEEVENAFSGENASWAAADGPAATVRLEVTQYGFTVLRGFKSDLVMLMRAKMQLGNADGDLVWEAGSSAKSKSENAAQMELYESDPSLIERALHDAAADIAQKLVRAFAKNLQAAQKAD